MAHLNVDRKQSGQRSGRRRARAPETLAELLVTLHQQFPRDTKEEGEERFVEGGEDDVGLVRESLRFYYRLNYGTLVAAPSERTREQTREQRAKERAETERRVQARLALNMMIGDKPLGEYTFKQIGELGGRFVRIAAKGKPNQRLREVLTDAELNE